MTSSSLGPLEPQRARRIYVLVSLLNACAPELGHFFDLLTADHWAVSSAYEHLRGSAQEASSVPTVEDALLKAQTEWVEELHSLAAKTTREPEVSRLLLAMSELAAQTRPTTFALDDLFDSLAEYAGDLYPHWPPQLAFAVRQYGGRGRRYGASAATMHNPDATVVLYVDPVSLGPATYLSIPHLLIHELICHVASRPCGICANASAWLEGFMDWAAECHGTRWLHRLGVIGPAASQHRGPLFEEIAAHDRDQAAPRSFGRRTAEMLVQRLRKHHGFEHEAARMTVANFAVRLNAEEAPLIAKDRFVNRVGFGSAGPLPDKLVAALRGVDDEGNTVAAGSVL